MKIILTNDDGIYSPGILELKKAMAVLGSVTVVAPDVQQSGVGHSITFSHPLRVRNVYANGDFIGYGIDGSPADCVKLAVREILKQRSQLLVSGINIGANVGINVLYSGTVAAAIEGALLGIPSIAISLEMSESAPDVSGAAETAKNIISLIMKKKLPRGTLLNVNIPNIAKDKIKGIKITKQFSGDFEEHYEKRTDPRGIAYYWLAGTGWPKEDVIGTDMHALKDGYISITPLRYDLTDNAFLTGLESWGWNA
ncbi:MAG: 5'/3'-nucleotidase SurE [Candidatus Scalindua rubra]|uniref:5'-nucleotidase SurE n=1 Tax=Candidatus Scalindua brodae TaxID=237368 RepID=A0A0B0EP10_9BACT|nr:MAG: survival protein [Candidatus Scalindua brodae]MBZ0110183.1 5'/3'-nucleotidase SurE [Candidatus Scalindua rubra]TWU30607.1 5'-nucleotidase SurE [Candidatus Brocadiaceae bacterium S225]